jgi:diguanylate cyclase (GGDEF)-like protein
MIEEWGTKLGELVEEDPVKKRIEDLQGTDNRYENSKDIILEKLEAFCRDLRESLPQGDSFDEVTIIQAKKRLELLLENHELKRKIWTDPLTGLKNRKALQEELPQLISLGERKNEDCAMLMLDLDNFKNINDIYGHGFGDQVLQTVGQSIKECARESDFLYRYGGEEFVVFLNNSNIRNAFSIAHRIREYIEKIELHVEENGEKKICKLSVSIGAISRNQVKNGTLGKPSDIRENMLDKSDKALYAAKKSGRNTVRIFYPEREVNYKE